MLTEKVGYQIGAGIEHDLQQKTSTYSGTSTISGLETFAINVDGVKNRTRGVGSVGMFYQVEKNQRLMGNVSIRVGNDQPPLNGSNWNGNLTSSKQCLINTPPLASGINMRICDSSITGR